MTDFTPITNRIRKAWITHRIRKSFRTAPEASQEFDRWLEGVKAEAWNEGRDAEAATWNTEIAGTAINPHERAISSDSRSLG